MGLFTPKYPTGTEPTKRESRADRRSRQTATARQNLAADFLAAEQASEERSARFWRR